MSPAWTIRSLLEWIQTYLKKQGLENPRVDAEILLSFVLKKKRIDLYVEFERPVDAEELSRLKLLIQRRANHEPLQYITGIQEFWSLNFKVGPGVFIPRPETECLIEKSLEIFEDRSCPLTICEIGTGSGVISIVLAKEFPKAVVHAVDISADALRVAQENANMHGTQDRITYLEGDLFSKIESGCVFDLIISNPPYLRDDQGPEMARQVKEYEPKIALFSGPEGMDTQRKIVDNSTAFLKKSGRLMMEIAPHQAAPLTLYVKNRFSQVEIVRDYEHRERVLVAHHG